MLLLAIIFPSLYFLFSGQLLKFLVCVILQATVIGWFPAAIWAVLDHQNELAERRHFELMDSGY